MNRSQYKKPSIKKTVRPVGAKKPTSRQSIVDIYAKSKEAIEKYRIYLDVEKNYSEYTVNGYVGDIEEFSEYFNLKQEEDEDVETIGGLVQKLLCRLAKINDEIQIENLKLRVVELKDRRIKKILVEQIKEISSTD